MADTVYTKDGVLAQMLIATGQGMGPVRVAQAAATKLAGLYRERISEELLAEWQDLGTHVLEKNRAVGRRIATELGGSGDTTVSLELAERCCREVAGRTRSRVCNREGGGG